MNAIAGTYNTVATLQSILRAEGWREDGHARWTKDGDPRKLIIRGSPVNGFYMAELR